jgi:hypothetical protein
VERDPAYASTLSMRSDIMQATPASEGPGPLPPHCDPPAIWQGLNATIFKRDAAPPLRLVLHLFKRRCREIVVGTAFCRVRLVKAHKQYDVLGHMVMDQPPRITPMSMAKSKFALRNTHVIDCAIQSAVLLAVRGEAGH